MTAATILVRHASVDGDLIDLLIEAGRIAAMGPDLDAPPDVETFDARGLVLWPGMVNTHHHLAQSMLKALPGGIDKGLADWLPAVPYAAWPHIDPETLHTAALIGFSELLRSGCTTCADHHYLYDDRDPSEFEDALVSAARQTGMRFVLCRGGATAAGTHTGMVRAGIVGETLETWLARLEGTARALHDPSPHALVKVAVAPTSLVHSVGPDDLIALAEFARARGLRLHSHLKEVARDDEIARARHGMNALAYAESVGWVGEDVWFAHLVHLDEADLALLARTGTAVSHCPTSNLRLGSGICPIPALADRGVRISLGVDGSASSESGSMANEAMLTFLLHRGTDGPTATTADAVRYWATRGGADVLGLDTGRLAVGAAADLVFYDLSEHRYDGLWMREHAPVICGEPVRVARAMVAGRWTVVDDHVIGVDDDALTERARAARSLLASRL